MGALAESSSEARLLALMHLCPTLHKLGQLLARDPRLSQSLRERLQSLESLPGSIPEEWDWPQDLVPVRALGEGSVAIALECTWRTQSVVVKRLKPGIAQRLQEEFQAWDRLSQELANWVEQDNLPDLDYQSTITSLTRLLEDELHPHREQQHLQRAAQRFLNWDQVQVPQVYPQLLEDGIVMEKLEGSPLLDHPMAEQHYSLAIQLLLSEPFFCQEEEGIFHLDPHPGNLWVGKDGRLILLDWGSTLYLSKHQRVLLTQACLAAWRGDQQDWELFAGQLTQAPVGQLPQGGSLSDYLHPRCWGTKIPVELILLRKILFHLEGLEAQLGKRDLLYQLFLQAGAKFLVELPLRLAAPADWRGYSTHISNLDVVRHALLSFFTPRLKD